MGSFVPFGVYTGLVGARFERLDRMESLHLLVNSGTPSIFYYQYDFYIYLGFVLFVQILRY